MPDQQLEDVTVYYSSGPPDHYRGLTRDQAREIELTLGSSPNVVQIDVTPAAAGEAG